MHRWIPIIALAACAGEVELDPQVPPPLVLDVPELYDGAVTTITVSGANPFDTVIVVAARRVAWAGSGPCPGVLGGACFDLREPTQVATVQADGSGVATITGGLPPYLPEGSLVYLQAASYGGGPAQVSNWQSRVVYAPSCLQTVPDFWQEAYDVRFCVQDNECGQVMQGTSCGCTRDWIANNNANLTDFYRLLGDAGQCGVALISTCDCPQTFGYECVNNQCQWDYTP